MVCMQGLQLKDKTHVRTCQNQSPKPTLSLDVLM